MNTNATRREAGMSILELLIALILGIVMLSAVSFTLLHGFRQRTHAFETYVGMSDARSLIAEIQQLANLPQDLAAREGIGAIFTVYNGAEVEFEDTGTVATITCFANETSVPADLGGPQDLNLDGDADDNLDNASAGTDLKIVPISIDVEFQTMDGPQTFTISRLITATAR